MQNLNFEISFYEELIKKHSDFTDALIALGDAYAKAGRYKEGLEIDQRLVKLSPHNALIHYNLACSYSLLEMSDLCLVSLEQAIGLGYCEFGFMEKDQDLEFIRKDPRYRELLTKLASKTLQKVSQEQKRKSK